MGFSATHKTFLSLATMFRRPSHIDEAKHAVIQTALLGAALSAPKQVYGMNRTNPSEEASQDCSSVQRTFMEALSSQSWMKDAGPRPLGTSTACMSQQQPNLLLQIPDPRDRSLISECISNNSRAGAEVSARLQGGDRHGRYCTRRHVTGAQARSLARHTIDAGAAHQDTCKTHWCHT